MKVLAIARFDSFIKEACEFLYRCSNRECTTMLYVDESGGELSCRQKQELLFNDISWQEYQCFTDIPLANYDVVFVSLTGGYIKKFCLLFFDLFKETEKRPLIVSSYPGIILKSRYEGYADRIGCDLVCVNSLHDFELFSNFLADNGIKDNRLFQYGFSIPKINRCVHKIYNVVFAEQVVIPNTFSSRAYLVRKLIDYAVANPNKNIIIKPRVKKGERTLFVCNFHIEDLITYWEKRIDMPSNIFVTYENINKLLETADELITVSSTVAVASIANNIPTYFVSDFGVNDGFGYSFVKKSGLFCSFQEIIAGNTCFAPNKDWLRKNITDSSTTQNEFFRLLEEKLQQPQPLSTLKSDFFRMHNEHFLQFKAPKNMREKIYFFLLKFRNKI